MRKIVYSKTAPNPITDINPVLFNGTSSIVISFDLLLIYFKLIFLFLTYILCLV